jgi:hypothetical protein
MLHHMSVSTISEHVIGMYVLARQMVDMTDEYVSRQIVEICANILN